MTLLHFPSALPWRIALPLCLTLALAACNGASTTPATSTGSASLSPLASVGKLLFNDPALSASGQQSCASCHAQNDPVSTVYNAFTAPNGLSVQIGGIAGDLPGLRNSPALTYALYTPAFSIAADGTPSGGFFLDGRAASLADQATQPFTNSFEMANASPAELQQHLLTRPYLAQLKAVFGDNAVADADTALANVGKAIAAFEQEDPAFHRFDSKYDAVAQGKAQFSAQELHGFALFNSPSKGNCAACHVSSGAKGLPALFTDHTYDNIGVPRNWAIAANNDASALPYVPHNGAELGAPHQYYDLGLCGPLRTDLGSSSCGQFKVPSLRNVAVKRSYFHNGVFHTLQDVVDFYITRDTDPARWYVQADGVTPDIAYNDLPEQFDANVNTGEAPYGGSAPTLNASERKDLISFLCTLTDGYDPANPAAYTYPAQCQQAAQ